MGSTSSRCLKTGSLDLADWMERLADAVADPIAKLSPVAPPPDAPFSPTLSTLEPGCTVPGRPVQERAWTDQLGNSSRGHAADESVRPQNFAAMLMVTVTVMVMVMLLCDKESKSESHELPPKVAGQGRAGPPSTSSPLPPSQHSSSSSSSPPWRVAVHHRRRTSPSCHSRTGCSTR